VVWRFVNVVDAGQAGRNAKDPLKARNSGMPGIGFCPAQLAVFRFGQRKASRNDARALDQKILELRQLDEGAGLVRFRGQRGRNGPAMKALREGCGFGWVECGCEPGGLGRRRWATRRMTGWRRLRL